MHLPCCRLDMPGFRRFRHPAGPVPTARIASTGSTTRHITCMAQNRKDSQVRHTSPIASFDDQPNLAVACGMCGSCYAALLPQLLKVPIELHYVTREQL